MSSRWQIHRRTFLRGVGTAMALPLLDAMLPTTAAADTIRSAGAKSVAPRRMAFIYVPNGKTMPHWTPAEVGANFTFPRILKPLEKFRDQLTVLSGFGQKNGFAMGDGPGDHARASASFLTGAHPRKTAGADIRAGISVDQVAAMKIGNKTALPSLELSCDAGRRTGSCDSGYACAYQYNLSWRSESMPVMPETDPRQVFERLFGDFTQGVDSKTAATRRSLFQKSLLDFVRDDARRLHARVGKHDQRKLDEYLTAVREIERRVERLSKQAPRLPDGATAPDPYETYQEHVRLMFDMLVLAFQTDSTRISTFIVGHEGSNRPYPFLGISDGHHELSHHRNQQDLIEKITRINCFHTEQFAYFLERLGSIREGDSTLLDNSMILYGSGISDGNSHSHSDLPILLAGRGGGTITPGRHIRVQRSTPLNNLFLSMLDRIGAPTDRFGDSTGKFEGLA